MTTAVIVDVVRTAVGKGKPGGALSGTHPVGLLAHGLRGIVRRHLLSVAVRGHLPVQLTRPRPHSTR